jgi:signal transduction histidine kinase
MTYDARRTTHDPLPTTHDPRPTTHYPLPTTHYPLPATHYRPPTTDYRLPTTRILPAVRTAFVQQVRAERVIAVGRLALALFASVAVLLDPDMERTRSADVRGVAGVFALYAMGVALVAWRWPDLAARARVVLHVTDLVLFSVFIGFTQAAVSPFFIFFLFSLLSALTRFGVRGMVITGIVVAATYIALATTDPRMRSDPAYLIMRITSLSVAALLLGYLGTYHERVREELMKLAGWPRVATEQREPLVRETLDLACDLLRAPRAVLAWEDEDEPWLYVAEREGSSFSYRRENPGVQPDVAADNDGISTIVQGQTVTGRIVFAGRGDFSAEDMAVAQVVGRLVANRLDQVQVAARVRDAAVSDERLRVARDLHDGLLQSLTGIALQLEITQQLLDRDAAAARDRLRNVQDLVVQNQRELRAMIGELRPEPAKSRTSLSPRLRELAERFQRQWAVQVSVDADLPATDLPEALALEIYGLVNEAVANAAKHAGATRIDVALRVQGGEAEIRVRDDGRGFPFHGTYSLDQLNAARLGPVTLKERVASLGGELALHSTPAGSTIEVRI